MTEKRKQILLVVTVALVSCLVTSAAKDLIALRQNGGMNAKLNIVSKVVDRYYMGDIDKQKMEDYAALGATMALGDPYTAYFDQDQFKSYMEETRGSFVGIGVVVTANRETNAITVVQAYEGSPGAKAGLQAGDVIRKIDGEDYTAETMDAAVSKMRGVHLKNAEGTQVNITVEREGIQFDVTVTRGEIVSKTVESRMMESGIGYLRIVSFDGKTGEEFNQHIQSLKDAGMQKLILDLRDNPGGDFDVVCKIADSLLPEGVITYTEDKNGKREYKKSDAQELGLPMVTLINGGSASASEVLSGALKDFGKSRLVGEKTFGKGIVQSLIPLSDGSGMKVTIAKYYIPSGVCIHGTGIEPDNPVKLPESAEGKTSTQLEAWEDTQLDKAVELLK